MNNLDIFEIQTLPYWKQYETFFRELKRPNSNQYNIELFIDVMNLDVNTKEDKTEFTPLHYASGFNNQNLVEYLIERGADINSENKNKDTALHVACRLNCDSIIKLLIKYGADTNVENDDKETPLMIYMKDGNNISVLELFISSGADLNKKSKYHDSLLDIIIRHNNYKFLYNLSKYIDINSINRFNLTPLMHSIITNKVKILEILLDLGADTSININGRTAWDLADDQIRKQFPNLNPEN